MNDHQINAVSVAIFDEKQRVLLIKRGQAPFLNHWSFAGGRVEKGETLLETAHREIDEELGLKLGDLVDVCAGDAGSSGHPFYLQNYASNQFSGDVRPAPDEVADWRFFALSDIGELTTTPHLLDWANKAHQKLFGAA